MNNLIAYKCLECGHYTISKYDGRKCAKCNGVITPMGNATNVDVSVKDIDVFKRMADILFALANDKHTPEWIKDKINKLVIEDFKS